MEISGEKWFCSNVDGAAIVLLARPEGAPDGPAGLGLYLVPRVLEDGTPNRYTIRRLKQKLGTKSVPTGEVELHGALGYALRPPGPTTPPHRRGRPMASTGPRRTPAGSARMMEMVNGSRFGVALMGLGIARRCFAEAAAWAHHRQAKGRALVDLPLVREQLVDQLAELEAAVALGFECAAASGFARRRPAAPHPRAGGQGAPVPARRRGGVVRGRAARRQRLLRGLGPDPPAPRRPVPSHLGGQREHLRARRAADHPPGRRPRGGRGPDRPGAWPPPAKARPAGPSPRSTPSSRRATSWSAGWTPWAGSSPTPPRRLSGRLCDHLVRTTSAALLLEQAGEAGEWAAHKGLVGLRYARRHLLPAAAWSDAIAATVGRELLASAPVGDDAAVKAAA